MKNLDMINVNKVEIRRYSNGCVMFTISHDNGTFELSTTRRNLAKYYKNNVDSAAIESNMIIDKIDNDVDFHPCIGCGYARIRNIATGEIYICLESVLYYYVKQLNKNVNMPSVIEQAIL